MAKDYPNLIVVVPTRNRAHLAIGAIRSVLTQNVDNVRILVSDNSTIAEETASLSRFCQQLKDERLRYIAPPEPFPMSRHWNWAMEQALRLDASHFTVLTDRMMFKPGELERLLRIVEPQASKIISYKHDRVIDYKRPVRLFLNEWTGKLFEIPSAQLLYLTSQAILHESLPRMLNCIVPRTILEATEKIFGNIFASQAPDFCFCYRALALEDSILFCDKAVLIMSAQDRSTGQAEARGITNSDHADFLADLGCTQRNAAAPIPQFRTVFNAILHEYYVVKKESGSTKFPEIDMARYLQLNASDMVAFEDENLKNQTKEILIKHGWTENAIRKNGNSSGLKKRSTSTKIRMKSTLKGATKKLRRLLEKRFAIRRPQTNELEFSSSEEALSYALKFPRPRRRSRSEDETLLDAKPVVTSEDR